MIGRGTSDHIVVSSLIKLFRDCFSFPVIISARGGTAPAVGVGPTSKNQIEN
jgi:hypothetical protein